MPKEILDDYIFEEENAEVVPSTQKKELTLLEKRQQKLRKVQRKVALISLILCAGWFGLSVLFDQDGSFLPIYFFDDYASSWKKIGVLMLFLIYPGLITYLVCQVLFTRFCREYQLDRYIEEELPFVKFVSIVTNGVLISLVLGGLILCLLLYLVDVGNQLTELFPYFSTKVIIEIYPITFYGVLYFVNFILNVYQKIYSKDSPCRLNLE